MTPGVVRDSQPIHVLEATGAVEKLRAPPIGSSAPKPTSMTGVVGSEILNQYMQCSKA
jgi:hypothetical protein